MLILALCLNFITLFSLQASENSNFPALQEAIDLSLTMPLPVIKIIAEYTYTPPTPQFPAIDSSMPSSYLVPLIPSKLPLRQRLFMIPPYLIDLSDLRALYRHNPY